MGRNAFAQVRKDDHHGEADCNSPERGDRAIGSLLFPAACPV